ncbi:MAG: PEP-utilizing enzyme [Acidimicrobiia bacterium]|nr:PEP-utilizing enzyme [Acidimicrobiia bacterium]
MTDATQWVPPGPGPWQQDSAHTPVSQTAIMQEVYPSGFNRGFTETFARYGVLLDRLAMGVVNGFTYHQPQPFDMPGPDGPMASDELEAEFGRRLGVATEVLDTRLWRQDLHDWDTEWKPRAIARHRELAAAPLADLDDASLIEHLVAVADHVSEMVYQHHRFNMAAVFPVGDFALHASEWTGRPPHSLLDVLGGYSPVSATLPDEMTAAVEAIRASDSARDLVVGTGDPAQRLAELRVAEPAVDDYLATVDCRLIEGFDLVNRTLREQPEIVLGKLAAGLVAEPEQARSRSDELAAQVRNEVPAEHRASYDELLGDARANYRLRDERGIYSEITAMGILRLTMLELGRRAHERGHIDDPEHILDATLDEAAASLSGAGPTATDLSGRGERRRALSAAGPPRHLGPPPPPPPSDELPPPLARLMSATGFMIEAILGQLDAAAGDASVVVGIPASQGSYEGTARLIHDTGDLLDLEDGEIVVVAATGEAFNSVLHLVGAIVTDHGSHACHAAIVSREMGIPAVVGTVDATTRIQPGDRIRVDGTKGEVVVLS